MIFGIFKYTQRQFFKYLRFSALLEECPAATRPSVFQMRTRLFLFAPHHFSENFNISKSKFKQVVFELFNFVRIIIQVHDNGFKGYRGGYIAI